MNTAEELKSAILKMDHRGYPAYKSLAGSWRFPQRFWRHRRAAEPWRTPWSVGSSGRRGGLRSGHRAPERAGSSNPAVRDRRSWSVPRAG